MRLSVGTAWRDWPALWVAAFMVWGLAACQQPGGASLKDSVDQCTTHRDLAACNDAVNMPGLSDADRAQAYAARARTFANLGRNDDALRDIDAAIKLDHGNKAFVIFKLVLIGSRSGAITP